MWIIISFVAVTTWADAVDWIQTILVCRAGWSEVSSFHFVHLYFIELRLIQLLFMTWSWKATCYHRHSYSTSLLRTTTVLEHLLTRYIGSCHVAQVYSRSIVVYIGCFLLLFLYFIATAVAVHLLDITSTLLRYWSYTHFLSLSTVSHLPDCCSLIPRLFL